MKNIGILIATFLTFSVSFAQEVSLPADLRQHTLTQYNASLFNPTFSLGRNNLQSISLWTRWQWQDIDKDPTTLFLNFTRSLNDKSAIGVGFLQHNTGIHFNSGGAFNYAYEIKFNRLVKLSLGANLFMFTQQLADDTPPGISMPGISQITPVQDFIMQLSPGFNLSIENFSLSFASENLFDYNFTDKDVHTDSSDKIFMGMASYNLPVIASDSTAFIRPAVYLRSVPQQKSQIGANVLFSAKKYWVQTGYDSFYGISAGLGATFFDRLSLGALAEFGTSSSLNSSDPSFELIASIYIGRAGERRQIVDDFKSDDQKLALAEEVSNEEMTEDVKKAKEAAKEGTEKVTETPREEDKGTEMEEKKSITPTAKEQKIIEAQRQKEALVEAKMKKEQEEKALAESEKMKQEKQKMDSINKAKKLASKTKEKVKLREGEKYQEVASEDGLEPGFYLIANVFGTKRYFDAFMNDLNKKGLQPKSFYRSENKYNYVYLQKYATINEARAARDSNFGGKYSGKTWIFRVVAK